MTLTVHATSFMQDILPASSCHSLGLTGRFISRLSICHSYKLSSSCAGTLYMVFLFVSNACSPLANDMGYAQNGAVCAVVFCRAYRPIGRTWTIWHALLGVADASVPFFSAAMFGLDAQHRYTLAISHSSAVLGLVLMYA